MEIQEFVNGVGGTPVTLYDGAVTYLPGSLHVAPASSINLIGTMRALNLTNLGSGWVVSTRPAAARTRAGLAQRLKLPSVTGAHRQAYVLHRLHAGCGRADRGELPHDWPGCGPRSEHRQPAALAQAGSPAVAAWIGSVTRPAGAELRRLPQRRTGDGAGGSQRERALERNIQRELGRASRPMSGPAMRCC